MATREQIEQTYNYLDGLWRNALGDYPDCSGAMYDGDFSLSLEQAQDRKHEFALDQLGIGKQMWVLDVGCGWGPMLNAIRKRNAQGIGITLSTKQFAYCKNAGFNVQLRDWKEASPSDFPDIAGILSIGSFEHFCSEVEYQEDRQDEICDQFFRFCSNLLPARGRMFLQTMTFGKSVPRLEELTLRPETTENNRMLALMHHFYPGSWLPRGIAHITEVAFPYFEVTYSSSGRLDYIQTIDEWNKRFNRITFKNLAAYARMIPYLFTDPDLMNKLRSGLSNANQECFKRSLFDHFRIVLEKKS